MLKETDGNRLFSRLSYARIFVFSPQLFPLVLSELPNSSVLIEDAGRYKPFPPTGDREVFRGR